ncbi:uncharacterized protein [Physcomitrium patens]|uniref:uncharacterized protein n=1 Tax=Physcomitrium patens TaxID=3218 RepID=UPI003CCD3F1D
MSERVPSFVKYRKIHQIATANFNLFVGFHPFILSCCELVRHAILTFAVVAIEGLGTKPPIAQLWSIQKHVQIRIESTRCHQFLPLRPPQQVMNSALQIAASPTAQGIVQESLRICAGVVPK